MFATVQPFWQFEEWLGAWEDASSLERSRPEGQANLVRIAEGLETDLRRQGFRLFNNGGRPLIERRLAGYRQEILLAPAPQMIRRSHWPFTVNLHLSNPRVARIRSRYWRPASRAPELVAAGNLGELSLPPRHYIFSAANTVECREILSLILLEQALPWFDLFTNYSELKRRLHEGCVPLIGESTAAELMLAEFDPFEARRFLEARTTGDGPFSDPSGYDLERSRLGRLRIKYGL